MAKKILLVVAMLASVSFTILHVLTEAYDLMLVLMLFVFIVLILAFFKALSKLERAKNEADMRTRIIVNSTPRICILFDSNYTLIDCNPATTQLLGFSTKEETLAGFIKRLSEVTLAYQGAGGDYVSVTDWAAAAALEGEIEFEHELNIDGKYHVINVEMKKVPYEDSFAIVGYASDVTLAHERENQLTLAIQEATRQRAEAEAANKAKSSFLSTMSHEIRTPMNAILGITEIQLMNQSLAPDVREAIEKIYSSGDLLLGIINNILDLSKIEAGKLELIAGRYSTASLISDSAQLNVMQIGSKLIGFELQIEENLPAYLSGDIMRVKQILNNLLSNAFKYTAKGTVTLAVSTVEETESDDELVLVLQVSDTGQGMSREQVDKLFNEFARFNMETNRTIEGTGLGMSITQNLIKLMNGEISIESEPGIGSTFIVCLPQGKVGDEVLGSDVVENLKLFRAGSRAQKRALFKYEPMPYGSVLIVDDMDTNIYVAMGLMSPYKLKMDSATSGFAAIDKIKAGNVYDIIFMDHMMPKMDGIEAVGLIRESGYKEPIIALTANAVLGNADMFLENGFDDFISKPIDMRQLNTILKKYIRDKQPSEVLEAALAAGEGEPDIPLSTVKLITPETVIPGLDITQGLARYDNNEAVYINILRAYTASLRNILAECANVSELEEKLPDYKIKVHGIKGASLNIYAEPLAAITFELEKAAASGDYKFVCEHNGEFLKLGNELAENLEALLLSIDKENPKPEREKPDSEVLKKLSDACGLYDIDEVDTAMEELEKYNYESDGGLMEWLKEKLALMQYPEIIERIKKEI